MQYDLNLDIWPPSVSDHSDSELLILDQAGWNSSSDFFVMAEFTFNWPSPPPWPWPVSCVIFDLVSSSFLSFTFFLVLFFLDFFWPWTRIQKWKLYSRHLKYFRWIPSTWTYTKYRNCTNVHGRKGGNVLANTLDYQSRPWGYKTFSMFKSAEHEILNVHKYKNIMKFSFFRLSNKPLMQFFLLINVKMPSTAGILIFMSRKTSCSAELSINKIS